MAKTIRINGISEATIDVAVKELRRYAEWVSRKESELIIKLAERGKAVASVKFASAKYDGTNDVSVRVDSTGSVAVIYAEGEAVAFIEFGSGAKEGYGHPQADEHGFGPGTWSTGESGKGHWDNPDGWYYAHGKKSHGNPPAMAMVSARDTMVEELMQIAREVFSDNG
jgi:hypothetical protein